MKTRIVFLAGFRLQGFNGIFALLLVCMSCHTDSRKEPLDENNLKEHLINANRIIVQDESKTISEFIERHQFKMTTTGTGLRIQVIRNGTGKCPVLHDTVSIACKVYLLDGTLCYSADESKPLRFRLGEGAQPRGLEEGLMLMKEDGQARMVLPSHLAFGLTGDQDKIPSGSALYYDVHLIIINP